MSAGTIWYKMQPNSEIATAISDLLTDYCGSVKSHDTTVKSQKIASLMAEILSRSDAVIVVGGMEAITPEENIVHLISRTLGIPLEEGKRSRSQYIFDTLHGTRLPSLKGSVLFPTRFGGPEGILLLSGRQTVIVLPGMTRAAVVAAVSIRKFLVPYVQERRSDAYSALSEVYEPKSYGKFGHSARARRQSVTREYSESRLNAVMDRAVSYARRKSGAGDDLLYRGGSADSKWDEPSDDMEDEYYEKLSRARKIRNLVSLVLVIGAIIALITMACLKPNGTFSIMRIC